jgi:hypothetical protein
VYTNAPRSHKLYQANVDRPQVNGGGLSSARSFVNRQSKIVNRQLLARQLDGDG